MICILTQLHRLKKLETVSQNMFEAIAHKYANS